MAGSIYLDPYFLSYFLNFICWSWDVQDDFPPLLTCIVAKLRWLEHFKLSEPKVGIYFFRCSLQLAIFGFFTSELLDFLHGSIIGLPDGLSWRKLSSCKYLCQEDFEGKEQLLARTGLWQSSFHLVNWEETVGSWLSASFFPLESRLSCHECVFGSAPRGGLSLQGAACSGPTLPWEAHA